MWAPPQLMHRGGEEEQQPGAALRLPHPGQVGLGHRCMARVWLREQMGQTGEVEGHLGATWLYPQQFLHWVNLLEEYAHSIVGDWEKSRTRGANHRYVPWVDGNDHGGGSLAFPGLSVGVEISGVRIRMFLESRIDSSRLGKSSSGSLGRQASGREWMARCASLGVRRKGNQGDSPTGNDLLSWQESASKYGAKTAAGVAGSVTRSVRDPWSLTLVVTARGRMQFTSLRTRTAISGQVAAIRSPCGYSVGEEEGG